MKKADKEKQNNKRQERKDGTAKRFTSSKVFWICLIASFVLMELAASYQSKWSFNKASSQVYDVIDFVKNQYDRYDRFMESEQTSAQSELKSKIQELDRLLLSKGEPSNDELYSFAEGHSLSGAFILDSDLQALSKASVDGTKLDTWRDTITDMLGKTDYSTDIITDRVNYGLSTYDCSVLETTDNRVIFCFKEVAPEISQNSKESFVSLLKGSTLDMGGIAAIVDDQRIITSNDDELTGKSISDSPVISQLREAGIKDELTRIRVGGSVYYGRYVKYSDYYIYVFFTRSQIYTYHNVFTAYTCSLFVLFWSIIILLLGRNDKKRLAELNKQLNINNAIGRIFTAYYLIDLRTNEMQVLKGKTALIDPKKFNVSVDGIIAIITDKYVEEEYRESAKRFLDFSDIDRRIKENDFLDETVKCTNGSWYFCSIIPKKYAEDGSVAAIIMTIRDVTTQTNAQLDYQQKLIKANTDLTETVNVLKSLRNIYFTSVYADLTDNTYKCLFLAPWLKTAVPESGKFTTLRDTLINNTVIENDREMLSTVLDLDYIKNSLHKDKLSAVRQSYYADYRAIRDGETKWCRVTVVAVTQNEDGTPKNIWALLQDIGEEKSKEMAYQQQILDSAMEAKQANAAKTEFLRRISHDIRTPINGIMGMLNIADHYPDDLEKQAECRRKLKDASGFLFDLVNDVLDMSKMESGSIKFERVPFDLKKLLSEVFSMTETQAVEKDITVTYELEECQHWKLIGSPLHVRQILLNVTGNAVKYNRRGGTIKMRCRETAYENGRVQFKFTCSDTGIGMSEDFQQHMFEPFTQENDSARTQFSGSGLGLSIVKKLTEKMGGGIEVQSRKDEGTTFIVTLSFETAKELPSQANSAAELSIAGTKALLAEDNELNMEIAQFILENEGVTVVTAENGQQAVDIFSKSAIGEFDFIVTDIMMPVADGVTETKLIRAMDRSDAQTIPIIAMTANAFIDEIETYRQAGMNGHITKPVSRDSVVKTIYDCLHKNEQ